jgi:hypothetical protein
MKIGDIPGINGRAPCIRAPHGARRGMFVSGKKGIEAAAGAPCWRRRGLSFLGIWGFSTPIGNSRRPIFMGNHLIVIITLPRDLPPPLWHPRFRLGRIPVRNRGEISRLSNPNSSQCAPAPHGGRVGARGAIFTGKENFHKADATPLYIHPGYTNGKDATDHG